MKAFCRKEEQRRRLYKNYREKRKSIEKYLRMLLNLRVFKKKEEKKFKNILRAIEEERNMYREKRYITFREDREGERIHSEDRARENFKYSKH